MNLIKSKQIESLEANKVIQTDDLRFVSRTDLENIKKLQNVDVETIETVLRDTVSQVDINKYKIEDLENDRHTHDNENILSELSESEDGKLLYKGNVVEGGADGNVDLTPIEDEITEIKEDIATLESIKVRGVVGEELDHLLVSVSSSYKPVQDELVRFDTVNSKQGELSLVDNKVLLKVGKTYRLQSSVRFGGLPQDNYCTFILYDCTNDRPLASATNGGVHGNTSWLNVNNSTAYITPKEDIEVGVKITAINIDCGEITSWFTYMDIQETGRVQLINPVESVNEKDGIEDTPVGHILSHMGVNAPRHYLICDGQEYNISDYPKLAEHFLNEFGTINYFGGDGVTTFAVPDLRGEFLRGTGTATRDTGTGAKVGKHQDPTVKANFWNYEEGRKLQYYPTGTDTLGIENIDKLYDSKLPKGGFLELESSFIPYDVTVSLKSSSRPTNTSVLYCIKYEPTYYMEYNVGGGNIDTTDSLTNDEVTSIIEGVWS